MSNYGPNNDLPAERASAVTPHDTNELDTVCRALYVGGAGNVSVVMNGTVVTFVGVGAGQILPIRTSLVRATLTTATSIVALY